MRMNVFTVIQIMVLVAVNGLVRPVGVDVGVLMDMLMGVSNTVVGVLMGVDMAMLMGVLQGDGVLDHKHRGGNHDSQRQPEPQGRPLPHKENAECHP